MGKRGSCVTFKEGAGGTRIDLTDIVDDYYKEYGLEISHMLIDETKKLAREVKSKLREESPKYEGDYRKGWRTKVDTKDGVQLVVYNATDWQLTHLLEKGHAMPNGVRRFPGEPHIGKVNDWAQMQYINRIEKRLKK